MVLRDIGRQEIGGSILGRKLVQECKGLVPSARYECLDCFLTQTNVVILKKRVFAFGGKQFVDHDRLV